MDLETLYEAVRQLLDAISPIAQKDPKADLEKKNFETLLEQVQKLLPDNELVKGMDAGPGTIFIPANDLLQKPTILKAVLEREIQD